MDTVKYLTDNFEAIYENASLPVILFDNKANLIRANQAFLNLAGASGTKIKSLSMTSLFKNLKPAFDRELIIDYQPDHTTSLSTLEGHTIPVRIYYSKLINDTGTQDTALSFIIDITDIHNSIEQIRALGVENRKFKEQLTGKTEDTVLS